MGDLVTPKNEKMWRIKFCQDVGHTYECVLETVTDMSNMFCKVCEAFNAEDSVDEILESMPVECFDTHLRKILETKECNCKHEVAIQRSIKAQTAKN